jgi:hypothetical protein
MELKAPLKEKNRLMLEMLNPMIGNLTAKEIRIVLYMVDNKRYKLNKDLRTDVRMSLDMEKFNFNNYLSKLKNKKILINDRGFLSLNPKISYMLSQESLTINFI